MAYHLKALSKSFQMICHTTGWRHLLLIDFIVLTSKHYIWGWGSSLSHFPKTPLYRDATTFFTASHNGSRTRSGMPTTGAFQHHSPRRPHRRWPSMAICLVGRALRPPPGPAQHVLRMQGTALVCVSWSSDQGAPRAAPRAFVSKRKLVMLNRGCRLTVSAGTIFSPSPI